MRKQLSQALAVIDAKVIKPIVSATEKRQASMGENVEDPRRIIRQGILVVVLFFGALGLWSVFGHISGAVVAPGKIKIETERKTVQHLEGGIVDAILVREGEEVRAGQPLIILESVQIDANASMLQKQLVAQSAAQIRLTAEKDLKDALQWPEDLRRLAENSHSADVLDNEERIFTARRDALNAQISLLNTQLAQLDAQVAEATRVFEEYAASEAGQQALLNQQAAREKELQEEIRKSEEASRNNQTAVGGFIWPTACRLITGGYGGRDAPCPGASTYHLGVDIGASWGSDIYATKAGTVMLANEGWNYGLGYCVKIQHDDGTSTVYGHMSRVIAVTGQRVAQGQVIGKIGSTGVSTGPHLHYEIRIGGVNGTAINPLPYLPGYIRYGW